MSVDNIVQPISLVKTISISNALLYHKIMANVNNIKLSSLWYKMSPMKYKSIWLWVVIIGTQLFQRNNVFQQFLVLVHIQTHDINSLIKDMPLLWWLSGLRCWQQFLGHLWCDPQVYLFLKVDIWRTISHSKIYSSF